jgi:hypothetical protein
VKEGKKEEGRKIHPSRYLLNKNLKDTIQTEGK